MIRATICEIVKNGKILLQYKADGRFGEGKWNGPGGKIKSNETPIEGVIREVKEETNLTLVNPELKGLINFYFGEKNNPDWVTYVFRVTEIDGELKANEEGKLHWFNIDEIPYSDMWKDDVYWLPSLIDGKKIKGSFWYNTDGSLILRHEIKIE